MISITTATWSDSRLSIKADGLTADKTFVFTADVENGGESTKLLHLISTSNTQASSAAPTLSVTNGANEATDNELTYNLGTSGKGYCTRGVIKDGVFRARGGTFSISDSATKVEMAASTFLGSHFNAATTSFETVCYNIAPAAGRGFSYMSTSITTGASDTAAIQDEITKWTDTASLSLPIAFRANYCVVCMLRSLKLSLLPPRGQSSLICVTL